MKQLITSLVLLLTLSWSAEHLLAQTPVTVIYKGKLANTDGTPVMNEECRVTFAIVNQDGKIYCEKKAELTTSDSGSIRMNIDDIPVFFSENTENEDVAIRIDIEQMSGASWLENNSLSMMYLLEKSGQDEFVMYTYEGQPLTYATMKPVWEFSDIKFTGQLSSRFIMSFSDEYADIESMEVMSKMMNGSTDIKPATPQPRKRGLKGGYAVGGYNRSDKKDN